MLTPRAPLASRLTLVLALAAPTLMACSDSATHRLAIAGNAAIADGLASTDFTDGWSVRYDQVLVVVHNPGIIERFDNKPAWVRQAGVTVWDVAMALEEGEEISRRIRAATYNGVDFRIAPAEVSGYEPVAGNVEDDVLDDMVDSGTSLRVVGTANSGGQTIGFDWSFDTNTFHRCKFEDDEVLTLDAEGDETTTIEILGDALFRTELGNPEASLAFDVIAGADADADGVVTQEELEAVDFGSTGYVGEGVDNLWEYLAALSREAFGVAGYGPCPEYVEPEPDEEG